MQAQTTKIGGLAIRAAGVGSLVARPMAPTTKLPTPNTRSVTQPPNGGGESHHMFL